MIFLNKSWKVIIAIIIIIIVICLGTILYKIKQQINHEKDYENRYNQITSNPKEIEKKWLIDETNIPYNLKNAEIYVIEQTYICFSPEIRVRRINGGEQYTFAVKANMSSDGMVRDEYEINITAEEYYDLLTKKIQDTITINKVRYQFYAEGQILAIDIFEGELKGLAYLEIEFPNEEEARAFSGHSWVIKDVTSDKRYKNQSLAKYGIPEE